MEENVPSSPQVDATSVEEPSVQPSMTQGEDSTEAAGSSSSLSPLKRMVDKLDNTLASFSPSGSLSLSAEELDEAQAILKDFLADFEKAMKCDNMKPIYETARIWKHHPSVSKHSFKFWCGFKAIYKHIRPQYHSHKTEIMSFMKRINDFEGDQKKVTEESNRLKHLVVGPDGRRARIA